MLSHSSTTTTTNQSSNANVINPSDTIETLFFKATSPIHKTADPNLMNNFCAKVNSEPEGHHLAVRLISHKIQSPQEHEALRTLELLDVCVLSCGRRFHQEIGKFRFLNEMIKLVSPKYLASHTSDQVKKKVIELLFSWTKTLPNEVKINEAYQMLKRQSIISEDPTSSNRSATTVLPQKTKSIFDQDPEKSKILERLLKSRKAEDLEQANALIKSLVKQEEEKTEKLSNRAIEIEKIQNNIRVLSEMLIHYNSSTVSEAERETMIYLHEELEKFRPILFRLATESEDDDEGLGEILSTSDNLSRVLSQYERLVKEDNSSRDDLFLPLLDDLGHSPRINSTNQSSQVLIDFPDSNSSEIEKDEKIKSNELEDLFGSIEIKSSTENKCNLDERNSTDLSNEFDLCPNDQEKNSSKASSGVNVNINVNVDPLDCSKRKCNSAFDELKELFVDPRSGISLSTMSRNSFDATRKIPINQLKNNSNPRNSLEKIEQSTKENPSTTNENLLQLEEIPDIQLERIRPSLKHKSIKLNLNNSTGLQCFLHFARETPRFDLIPVVLSLSNTNTEHPIENILFRVFLSKNIRIKINDPSSLNLPVYNPILSPPTLTQLLILSNPNKESIEFAYRLQYFYDGKEIVESGFIDQGFPTLIESD